MKLIAATLILGALAISATAQTKRIYIANDDHTDYFWTADDVTYRAAFLEQLDYYLALADSTSNSPPAFQSRWNCDGSFWLWEYERNKSAADFERLIARIKSGHISTPMTALVSCYGGAPAEAVLRGMYYAGRLERRYGLRFRMAVAMENQTLPCGLASLWAGAGARWSWRGVCACASRVPSSGDREHDIYWWAAPDGSRILMKWYDLLSNSQLGGYAEARDPSLAVDQCDAKCFTASYPYGVAGAFGKGWDDLKTLTSVFPAVAQAKTTTNRQVIVSNEEDFFQDFEAAYGTNLPTVTGTFGNEWELYCASMAEVSARVKRSVEQLRAAEALATLVALQQPAFATNTVAARDLAMMNLGLYWEHDWTADGPVARSTRAAWSRRIAGEIESYVTNLHAQAAAALGGLIPKSGTNLCFYAFNPLSWTRTDFADAPCVATGAVHVVDLSTGQETPSQMVTNDGVRALRILAREIPSVGYKVFEVRPGAGAAFPAVAALSGNVLSNGTYFIRVAARGAITNLIDKTRGNREFAMSINNRWINDLAAGANGILTAENVGPVSVTLRADSTAGLNHITRITLFRDSPRIECRNDIHQNFADVRTWAFSFNLAAPEVHFEEVGAILRAKKQSQGGHYSDRAQNCRYDWLTLNHFADMTGTNAGARVGVTLANADCYFAQLGNSTAGTLDTATAQLAVLAGGQVDGTGLGIQSQGGDAHFLQRFALRTHDAYDAVAAMKFALEFQNPLVTGTITGGSAYPATNYSHLTINNPNVLLWALKPAEEGIGDGMVARVWNVSAQSAPLSLALAQPLNKARRVTHIETDVGPAVLTNGVLSATLNPQQLQTFKLQVAPQLRASIDAERVILSWPSHAASYALEAAANPGPPPPDWVPLTNSPQPAGEHLQITLQAAGSHQFFRLRQP